MATRSFIAQKLPSGSFRAIYCHWDGHPDTAGLTLHRHYSSDSAVDGLLALGNLSELGGTPESCVAYHRDKGEDLAPATEYLTYPAMTQACFKQSGGEFLYVWEDGAWLCNSKPLAPILAKSGLLPAVEQPASPEPDWAVLGPRLAASVSELMGTFENGFAPRSIESNVKYAPGVKFTLRPTVEQIRAVQDLLPSA